MRYREFLLDIVEKKVKIRRSNQRQKKIDNLRYDDETMTFEAKKQRVERRIEEVQTYFNKSSNLRNPQKDLKRICKQLAKIEKRLMDK